MKIIRRDKYGQLVEVPEVLEPVEDLPALIERMYRIVGRSLRELEKVPELGSKEINALVSLGKLLPMLEQAELTRQTKINRKSVKDLSHTELKKLATRVLRADAKRMKALTGEQSSDESNPDASPNESIPDEST